jgi:hypothetical protein
VRVQSDVVIVADYEMEKYPGADGLERAIRTVLPGLTVDAGNDTAVAEDYHAVCAYGVTAYKLRMWKPILYYDTYVPPSPSPHLTVECSGIPCAGVCASSYQPTSATRGFRHVRFATVLENGTFARARNVSSVSDNGARATALTAAVVSNPSRLYPVQSCFGGMAVYVLPAHAASERFTAAREGERGRVPVTHATLVELTGTEPHRTSRPHCATTHSHRKTSPTRSARH